MAVLESEACRQRGDERGYEAIEYRDDFYFSFSRVSCTLNAVEIEGLLEVAYIMPVAPVGYQVILEPGIGQFREFESPRVHTRINSWGLFFVHKLTCGKCESAS